MAATVQRNGPGGQVLTDKNLGWNLKCTIRKRKIVQSF